MKIMYLVNITNSESKTKIHLFVTNMWVKNIKKLMIFPVEINRLNKMKNININIINTCEEKKSFL